MKFQETNLTHLRRLKREIEIMNARGHVVDYWRHSVVGARIIKGRLQVRLVHGYMRWHPVNGIHRVVDGGRDPLFHRIERFL